MHDITSLWNEKKKNNNFNMIFVAVLRTISVNDHIFNHSQWTVETLDLQLCLVEDLAEGRRKRRAGDDAEQGGEAGSAATTAIVAGAWLTPIRRQEPLWRSVT
jgi:hypothetical protein